jgi:glycosyltransferase involved in cell wall biosynthesis
MICFFNTTKEWGGGEKWHYDMAARMHADGLPVMVVTNKKSALFKKVNSSGIPCFQIKIGNLSFLNPLKIYRLKSFFQKHPIKTVVMNLPSDLKSAGVAARMAGVERIIYRRGSAIAIKNSFFNRFLFSKIITNVLANSEETKRTVLAKNPNLIDEKKIRVIYNGIHVNNFIPHHTERFEGKVIIGNLGRLEKQKAHHLLIILAEKLRAKGHKFIIKIGGEGRLRTDLEKLIAEKNLQDFVQLTGHVVDTSAFFNDIEIFVLTSLWEGFGYVLAEAMAMQKPVVAFNVSSNGEVVENGVTGFLALPGNVDDLCRKVEMLINNKALSISLGMNGRKCVIEKFDFEKVYAEVKNYLFPEIV